MIKINQKEKALVNSETGEIFKPTCFDTMSVLHSYYESTRRYVEARTLLEDVFAGEKVISNMAKEVQKYNLDLISV